MKSAILLVGESDIPFAREVIVMNRLFVGAVAASRAVQSSAQIRSKAQIRRSRGNQGIVMADFLTPGTTLNGSPENHPSQAQCGGIRAVWRGQITKWPCETAPAPITSPDHPHISSHPKRSDSPWLASP